MEENVSSLLYTRHTSPVPHYDGREHWITTIGSKIGTFSPLFTIIFIFIEWSVRFRTTFFTLPHLRKRFWKWEMWRPTSTCSIIVRNITGLLKKKNSKLKKHPPHYVRRCGRCWCSNTHQHPASRKISNATRCGTTVVQRKATRRPWRQNLRDRDATKFMPKMHKIFKKSDATAMRSDRDAGC